MCDCIACRERREEDEADDHEEFMAIVRRSEQRQSERFRDLDEDEESE